MTPYAPLRPRATRPASRFTASRPASRVAAAWPAAPSAALAALLLAACGSTPVTRFHTLQSPAAVAPAVQAVPAPNWELLPVRIPPALDQPQWVVRLPDDTLAVLEYDRWAAPLADEIRAAVAQRLATVPLAAVPGRAAWRVDLDVQRLDSALGRQVKLEAEWTLRRDGAEPLRCRGAFEQAAGPGSPALAAAQRQAVQQLGDALAATLRQADAKRQCAKG